jgi:hypothetical protein
MKRQINVRVVGDVEAFKVALSRDIPLSGVGVIGEYYTAVHPPAWLHRLGRRPLVRGVLRALGFVVKHETYDG